MDDELIKKINECGEEYENIRNLEELRYLRAGQVKELGEKLEDDEDKLKLLPYIKTPMAIISNMKTDSIILKALESISLSEENKLKVIVKYLKSDEAIKSVIDELDSDKNKYLASLKLSRAEALKYFSYDNMTYTTFGLNERITIGMEIEAECLNPSLGHYKSDEILEIVSNYRSGRIY